MSTNQQPATTTVTEAELARAQAELEAGGDPFGDGDPLEFEKDDDEIPEAQATGKNGAAPDADQAADGAIKPGEVAATPEAGATGGLTAEEIAATLAAISPQQAAELNIDVPNVAGIVEQITVLDAAREATEQKWMAGTLDDKARLDELRKLNARERDLNRQLAKAETLAEIVQQQSLRQQQQVLDAIRREALQAGVDYTSDAAAAQEFDAVAQVLASQPHNQSKSAAEIYAAANRAVLAARGIVSGQQLPPDSAQGGSDAQRRAAPPIPPTIRGLPQAASQTTGGGVVEVMRGLKGHEYTQQWERLTPAQQAALLDD